MSYPTYTYYEVVMKQFAIDADLQFTAQERAEIMESVRYQHLVRVSGFEALSVGEQLSLFFKEISTGIDKRMASLAKSIHKVDFIPVKRKLEKEEILYVKNTATEILAPEGYIPGLGNMRAYTESVCTGVYIIATLQSEASRLYDWMKQIIVKGRMEHDFKWAVSDFSIAVTKSEDFVKNLPDRSRNLRYNLGQVYMSYEEAWDTMQYFNNSVSTMGGRDVEITAKILGDVYDLGQIMIKKIHANDIMLDKEAVTDVETIINRFAGLTNIAGALMVLLNELTAVFNSQLKTLSDLKY